MSHEVVEKNVGLMTVLILLVISIAGLVEIVPLFFLKSTTEPVEGLKPYTALQLEGRDVYIREGCYVCHSQMIRPFRAETERYGHYSVAGEFVYDHPFQWGSKRTGPDLARVGPHPPLDDDLRVRRHPQRHRLRPHHLDPASVQEPRHQQLADPRRQRRGRGRTGCKASGWRRASSSGHREFGRRYRRWAAGRPMEVSS